MDSNTIRSLQEAYQQVSQLMELTGGKGHRGYKSGSRDLGPMQSGHPADSFKRTMKGGTMSMRHGDHLGDLDDKDDDGDGLEAGLKDTARKKRENVREPLRNKVKSARKLMTKEDYELDVFDIILEHLVAEGYADTEDAALKIMANMSEDWRESIVEEVLKEGEKPFPYEKVTAQQKKHSAAGNYGNTMKMGLAKRRAKEADKKGGSQQDAGKGWYHGK